MSSYTFITLELEKFISKYYKKKLIKGILFFISLGLLFFLGVIFVEYLLWLGSNGRLILFLSFVLAQVVLVYYYILVPVFYLFRLRRGIDNKEASLLIGKHFPEIGDKLYNLLDLSEDNRRSELLLASIEQRSANLRVFPFLKAIDFRDSFRYIKLLVIPITIFVLIWISGELTSFFGSFARVVNYDLAYEAPAPFRFKILTEKLSVLENDPFTLQVTTEGSVVPDNVALVMYGKEHFLQNRNGTYQYTFISPTKDVDFYFRAGGISSGTYRLEVLKAPTILDFYMLLEYPAYTGMSKEIVKGTGNALVAEGTKVSWKIQAGNTEAISLIVADSITEFQRKNDSFELYQKVYSSMTYSLSTANRNVRDFERLEYRFNVVKDLYPTLRVSRVADSLNPNVSYFFGEASDDYGLSELRLVCYPKGQEDTPQEVLLERPAGNFTQFYYTYPSGLALVPGVEYSFYFEVIDNDAIHKGKRTRSEVFNEVVLSEDELKRKDLEMQQSIIDKMDRSLDDIREQKRSFKELDSKQSQTDRFNFSDQNRLKDFLNRQQEQEGLMEKFSKSLKEILAKDQSDKELNKLLQERLERQELEARKNERLLEELRSIADKLNKEELMQRLEEMGNKQQNSQRNLEQLVELTKRYYVSEKAAQLAMELEKVSKLQETMAEQSKSTSAEQRVLNENFDRIAKELMELREDNADLKKPVELNINEAKEDAVKEDQKEALDKIIDSEQQEQGSTNSDLAKKRQRAAAQKMQEMSESLRQASTGGGEDAITEDAEVLRQILENLVAFSFSQECVYNRLRDDLGIDKFSEVLRKQRELRLLFEHVDDSLFSLSLRRAELSEFVNKQITEVYYNTDKALERMVDGQILQANASQQYVLTAANSLADYLAGILDNMQESMKPGQGSGGSSDFQLPDIIKGQQELKEKMEGLGGEGKAGKEGEGQSTGEGSNGDAKGESGKRGEGRQGEGGSGSEDGQSLRENGGRGHGDGQGNGDYGLGEDELKEIYEIYKAQQFLKNQLEAQLKNMIDNGDRKFGEKLLKQMEDFENDLLENGITQRTTSRMNTISYELLKLKNAELKQGEVEEREGNTNRSLFQNPVTTKPAFLENYRNDTEILQRQALPLQQIFQGRVKDYFREDD